jgi:hypothetical protein
MASLLSPYRMDQWEPNPDQGSNGHWCESYQAKVGKNLVAGMMRDNR